MSARAAAAIMPRLLTLAQAAAYCGMPVSSFVARCPVQRIALGEDRRLERFDVHALDEWIDNLRAGEKVSGQRWLDQL